MRNPLSGSGNLLTTAWRIDRRRTVVGLVLMVAGAAAAPLLAAVLGRMTDAMVAGNAARATVDGVIVAVLAVVGLTFAHFGHIAYFEVAELAHLDFDEQLIDLSNGSAGLEHHERSRHADTITVLAQESRQYQNGLEAMLGGIALAIAGGITAVLLARANPWLLLLPPAAAVPLLAGRLAGNLTRRAKDAAAEPTRRALNLFELCTAERHAGELRVFGLRREMLRRHEALWRLATRRQWRANLAATGVRAAGQLVFALAYVGTVLLLLHDAILGRRSVGDVVLVVTLAVQVNQQVLTAVTLAADLQRVGDAYRRLAELRAVVTRPPVDDLAPPDRLTTGIRLDGVGFTYPDAAAPTLSDVHLLLPAGSTVAVVGENGAGKSTLVNLLCGFYRPTSGRITADGVDLSRVPPRQWRQRLAGGFQDFVRFELVARESVGLGDLPRMTSPEAVVGALRRAHATDVIDGLPEGLETQLGHTYAEGAELSGGQWQKLALGRALMRPQPLLLMLDEPTSALDAEAEHALFERYADNARRAARASGAITLLVSHRFGTVRTADLIVVVRDGRVAEAGSHAELMAAAGLYAELFRLQAEAYADQV